MTPREHHAGGRVLKLRPADPKLIAEMRDVLREHCGEKSAAEIESAFGGLDRFLSTDFYPYHVRMYQRRPPYWALGSADSLFLIAHDYATPAAIAPIARLVRATLPTSWKPNADHGVALNLSPLRALVVDPAMRKLLESVDKDAEEGRYAWKKK